MDQQINDIIGRHSYLDQDPAVFAAVRGGQPFRCVFFDSAFSALTEEMTAQQSCIDTFRQSCARGFALCTEAELAAIRSQCQARDINYLYFAYNFYCQLESSTVGNALGRTTNRCRLAPELLPPGCTEQMMMLPVIPQHCYRGAMMNVFATQTSIAYFREANRRFQEGELRMVNFTQSDIYREKMAGLGLEQLQAFDVSNLLETQTNCTSFNYRDHLGNMVSVAADRWYSVLRLPGGETVSVLRAANCNDQAVCVPSNATTINANQRAAMGIPAAVTLPAIAAVSGNCAEALGNFPNAQTNHVFLCLPAEDWSSVEFRYNSRFRACQRFNTTLNRFAPVDIVPGERSTPRDLTAGINFFDTSSAASWIFGNEPGVFNYPLAAIENNAINHFIEGVQRRGVPTNAADLRYFVANNMRLIACPRPENENNAPPAEIETYARCLVSHLTNYCGMSGSFFDPASRSCITCERGAWNPVIRMCQSGFDVSITPADVELARAEWRFQNALAMSITASPQQMQRAVDLEETYRSLRAEFERQQRVAEGMRNLGVNFDYSIFTAPQAHEGYNAPRDVFTDLGIQRTSSLFSINVVPPIGAGTLFPGYLFGRASDFCFSGQIQAENPAQIRQFAAINRQMQILANCAEDYRNDLERYYLTGFWPMNRDGRIVYEEQNFLSARRSCDLYEQALISVRDRFYGEFDTAIKTFLDEAVRQVVQNHLRQIQRIAQVAQSFQEWDHEITMRQMERVAERRQREIDNLLTEAERANEALRRRLEADRTEMRIRRENRQRVAERYNEDLLAMCGRVGGHLLSGASVRRFPEVMAMLSTMSVRIRMPEPGSALENWPIFANTNPSVVLPMAAAGGGCAGTGIINMDIDCHAESLASAPDFVEYRIEGNEVRQFRTRANCTPAAANNQCRVPMNAPNNAGERYMDFFCADWGEEFTNHPFVQAGIAYLVDAAYRQASERGEGGWACNRVASVEVPLSDVVLPMGIHRVMLNGAGGGGADCRQRNCNTGSGGSGGRASRIIVTLEPVTFSIAVGGRGAGASAGGTAEAGGNTTFSAAGHENLVGQGGGAGTHTANGASGAGTVTIIGEHGILSPRGGAHGAACVWRCTNKDCSSGRCDAYAAGNYGEPGWGCIQGMLD